MAVTADELQRVEDRVQAQQREIDLLKAQVADLLALVQQSQGGSDRAFDRAEGAASGEMQWFHEHRAHIDAAFAGEWIAMSGQEVVAHGGDLTAVMGAARRGGHQHPFVVHVPRERVESLHV
jgi:hypothetical protein